MLLWAQVVVGYNVVVSMWRRVCWQVCVVRREFKKAELLIKFAVQYAG